MKLRVETHGGGCMAGGDPNRATVGGERAGGAAWGGFEGFKGPVRIFNRQSRTENLDRTDMMTVWGDMRFYEG